MDSEAIVPRPSPAVWFAWGLALTGGLFVALAAVRALLHPCLRTAVTCTDAALSFPGRLALAGTVTAVAGGIIAVWLLLQRR